MAWPRGREQGQRLRVATWNIRHGAGADGVVDLDRTAATIRSLEAEVIGLQEVDRGWARSGHSDQAALLEASTGLEVVFKPTLVQNGSEYGLAIATSRQVTAEVEPLPRRRGDEPRAVIVARTGGMTVLVTHLSVHADARREQIEHLADLVRRVRPPVVLLGDLNEGRSGLKPLRRAGLRGRRRRSRTVPAPRPLRQIDHVLAGRGAVVERSWAVDSTASDHRPLAARIRLPGAVTGDHY